MAPDGDAARGPVYDLVAEVLVGVAPEEAADLPLVWEAWRRNPVPPSALHDRERLLGSGLAGELVTWAPLVVSFLGTQVVGGAMVDAAKDGLRSRSRNRIRSWRDRWRRRRGRAEVEGSVPRLTPAEIRDLAAEAERAAVAVGRTPEEARVLGDHLAGVLTRRAAA
ncbi:hypothetical protein [Actinomycetospora cinnamomea]|uniref:Uncharacterized protein n=1 Tax=Actinomycetospora cinnamomea TaxID=663609 RepID=A0A2U1EXA3_9PSEU|nr:hypothetical protein [Actinomycetospora cinnamomea]PVZ04552.1 hypothetical protein C8D89_1175 [Actinomycetospora cinnamomea]